MALFGLGKLQGTEAPSRGWNLSQTILPEGGILAMAFDGALALADKAGNAALNFADGLADRATDAGRFVFGAVSSVSLGSSHSMSPEPAVVQVQAPLIAAPSLGKYDVDPAELFTFSAPNFNAIPLEARGAAQSASV